MMIKGRLGDVLIGTIGEAAGAVLDPRPGGSRLRATAIRPTVLGIGVALVTGYLLGRRRHG